MGKLQVPMIGEHGVVTMVRRCFSVGGYRGCNIGVGGATVVQQWCMRATVVRWSIEFA